MNQCLSNYRIHKENGFSRQARKKLFNGLPISPKLSFDRPDFENIALPIVQTKQISISGVQIKYSLKIVENQLVVSEKNGEYILKPIPFGNFAHLVAVPENEHLTMQIAQQIFGIETAFNSIIFFQNDEMAYLVKRFDYMPNGEKFLQEDFAQIKQTNRQIAGENYKYEGSYEEIAQLIRQYCAASFIEVERFYKQILFNYLFSNGDAHLKNFSLIQTIYGDFRLSPAYDLLCTGLHIPHESAMALDLFANDYYTKAYDILGFYSYQDFFEFGVKIGINELRVKKILLNFSNKSEQVENLIAHSFLSESLKNDYQKLYFDRLNAMKYQLPFSNYQIS